MEGQQDKNKEAARKKLHLEILSGYLLQASHLSLYTGMVCAFFKRAASKNTFFEIFAKKN